MIQIITHSSKILSSFRFHSMYTKHRVQFFDCSPITRTLDAGVQNYTHSLDRMTNTRQWCECPGLIKKWSKTKPKWFRITLDTPYGGQFTLSTPLMTLSYSVILSHRSTTVSLEHEIRLKRTRWLVVKWRNTNGNAMVLLFIQVGKCFSKKCDYTRKPASISVFNVVGFPTKEIHTFYGIHQNWAAVQK